jgi:hypothetical protein
VAWKVDGAGQVGIDDGFFEVGSPELAGRLQNTDAPVTSLQVYAASSLRVIFFIDAVLLNICPQNEVRIRGLDARVIAVSGMSLSPGLAAGPSLDPSLKKLLPTIIP